MVFGKSKSNTAQQEPYIAKEMQMILENFWTNSAYSKENYEERCIMTNTKEEHFLMQAMKEYFGDLSLQEQNLIASAINKMDEDLVEAVAIFDIGSYDTYEWLEDKCMMLFSDENVVKIVTNAHYVGSIVCGEWRWSWDKNENKINDNCKALMQGFKTFVQQYNFSYFKQNSFPADERIGWVMSAIASLYGKAKLVYKIERCEATEFYVFSHIKNLNLTYTPHP